MRRTHDADLCERIRRLEKRIEELEAQPRTIVYPHLPHHCWSGCPEHYPTITWNPNTTWMPPQWSWTNSTPTIVKGVSTDTSTYVIGDIS